MAAKNRQELSFQEGRDPYAHQLVERFLQQTVWSGMDYEEAGKLIGRSGEGVRLWERGTFKALQHATRKALEEFLEGVPRDAGPGWIEGYREAVLRMRRALQEVEAQAIESAASLVDPRGAADALPPAEEETRKGRA